nr:MAG TPA: hypothetical protein [Caudoviricetes sp.]
MVFQSIHSILLGIAMQHFYISNQLQNEVNSPSLE